jgi:hypothetical protein
MTFFTAAQLSELRAVQESAFADTCTIADPSHKTGQQGQQWTARASSVACGVSSLSQAIQSGQVSIMPSLGPDEKVFVFGFPTTVAPITQGARITWDGDIYEVRSVDLPGTYGLQVQVMAVRL